MLRLDHLAVSGLTRAAASAHLAGCLAVDPVMGGEHAVFHTHNTLLGLGPDFYLEAIATNPSAPTPDRPRWFNLDAFAGPPRLTNWIVATDDIQTALATLGPGYGAPVQLERGELRWQMAVPDTGLLPFDGFAPAVIEWGGPHPAPKLPDCGLRFDTLTVRHPHAQDMAATLAPLLNDDRIHFQNGTP
ncbi:MAG: VOC family protein, partial [Pseudomonadota bacterium]